MLLMGGVLFRLDWGRGGGGLCTKGVGVVVTRWGFFVHDSPTSGEGLQKRRGPAEWDEIDIDEAN